MTPLDMTVHDLAGFYKTASEAIAIAGASALHRSIQAETDRMVSEPWRISLAVYGDAGWPAQDMSGDVITPENVLADCRRFLQSEPLGRRRNELNIAQLALMQIRGK